MSRSGVRRAGDRQHRLDGWLAFAAAVGAAGVAAFMIVNASATESSRRLDDGAEMIAHVHGVGVDPGDGAVHVATHNGVFRLLDNGTAERVSDEGHDFMGFTVVGDDHFLASGHPALGTPAAQELERPLFGLIESTDGGTTWTAKSLSGQVDFHALEAAHGKVYGFDATSTRFLVSADGVNWESRSTAAIVDFAVDPDDAERIVASTGEGVIESDDGGRTWASVEAAPPVVFLDWHAERGLWGLDTAGQVHRFDGSDWLAGERLSGSPQALVVDDTGVIAAVDDGSAALHRSSDGIVWDLLYREEPAD